MSTDIIYNQFFVQLPTSTEAVATMERIGGFELQEHDRFWMTRESKFFWVMQSGSSNCYNQDGTRARSWCIPGMGRSMINRALAMCTDIEGGMLQPNGRSSSPESFLKNVRALLKQAVPLEALSVVPIRWSLPQALVDENAERPIGDREVRIWQAAQQLSKHPYTKYLIETGRLVLETDSWPFDDRKVVRFTAAGNNEPPFLADYLWLSMLDTYYGEQAFYRDPGQSLGLMFDGWARQAEAARQAA